MATISPTLRLTANASSASTPGPLSFALSLSATDAITVNGSVEGKVAEVTTSGVQIFDCGTAGEAYVYLNNTSDSTIYVGKATDAADTDANRFMALRAGEFAWFPWWSDSTGTATDIFLDHSSGGTKTCEYWIFYIT
tara:strand:- start:78 stop:488 length:411 start_codon:yes stop_codon:yes gene_type:complete